MKIQSLAVIFAIIILPIVIILSYFIHAEVDTIAIQTGYDTKLIDSTHDAMAALEINTANEDLSSVADSLRSIIEASTNVFFNTLATNLGISNAGNASVDAYVPAVLYTLYDGYYIYSPTRVPEILTADDDVVYVGDKGVTCLGYTTYNAGGVEKRVGRYKFESSAYVKGEKNDSTYGVLEGYGISHEYGQMLYLNEDGTYSPQVHHTDGRTDNTKYKQSHILKSYMPYSARYQGTNAGTDAAGDYDLTINYTLDNYLTIEGNIGAEYYSKTGYLISSNTVTSATANGEDLLPYNEKTAEEMILAGDKELSITIDPIMENGDRPGGIEITYSPMEYDGEVLSYSKAKEILTKLYEKINTDDDGDGIPDHTEDMAIISEIQRLELGVQQLGAIAYYVKAEIFSDWVYSNLNNIRASNVADDIAKLNEDYFETESKFDLFHSFKTFADDGVTVDYEDTTLIFQSDVNPELADSAFYSHKVNVIRNNIQYNLNLAISAYNEMLQTRNVQMPVIKDSEWEQILTRVSVTSFMQGLQCGMKVYNNYAIASSTNNELTMLPTEMYYTVDNEFNTANVEHEYHKIDCDNLPGDDGTNYISFTSKDIKYDKIYDRSTRLYAYDHRNLGCYRCAIPSNYEKDVYDRNGNPARGYSDDIIISLLSPAKKKAYYVGTANAKQAIYKTNAITDSNGFEVINQDESTLEFLNRDSVQDLSANLSARPIKEVREVEVTLSNLKCDNASEATVNFTLILNGSIETDYSMVLNLEQATPQTMVFPIHITDDRGEQTVNRIGLKKIDLEDRVTCRKLNVRIVYE